MYQILILKKKTIIKIAVSLLRQKLLETVFHIPVFDK